MYLFTHESHLLLPLVPDAFGRLPIRRPPAFHTKYCHAHISTSDSETQAGHQTTSRVPSKAVQYHEVECVLTGHCKISFVQDRMQLSQPTSLQLDFLAAWEEQAGAACTLMLPMCSECLDCKAQVIDSSDMYQWQITPYCTK